MPTPQMAAPWRLAGRDRAPRRTAHARDTQQRRTGAGVCVWRFNSKSATSQPAVHDDRDHVGSNSNPMLRFALIDPPEAPPSTVITMASPGVGISPVLKDCTFT